MADNPAIDASILQESTLDPQDENKKPKSAEGEWLVVARIYALLILKFIIMLVEYMADGKGTQLNNQH